MKTKIYNVYGWVDTETCVELGTWESRHSLHDTWDLIMQIFNEDNVYAEGIYVREVV